VPDPVLITTDLDRTLIFSRRATAQLGGALPADPVESAGTSQAAGELSSAVRDALLALPCHVRICVATSRSLARLARLRLPFVPRYSIAANGGVVLAGGAPDPEWAARTARLLAGAAPAADVRAVIADSAAPAAGGPSASWLDRFGDEDDLCCLAIVDRERLAAELFADVAARCAELGWQASLTGRKLYAFPAGFGKEHAAAFVADMVAREAGAPPLRLAAGDAEHDQLMLADADRAWIPAGSELAASSRLVPGWRVTRQPGHAAAAEIAGDWLAIGREQARRAG
jgi:predicted mannosyl-3-phosphoglycerate phosphatase (HAD superfamily)